MQTIRLHDKVFLRYIPQREIEQAISRVAAQIDRDYADRDVPLFVGVLNGSFLFMAELLKRITLPCEVSFVKVSSYRGTESSGSFTETIGMSDDIRGRHVLIVEDVVDTGNTVEYLTETFGRREPASVEVVSLLLKPDAYTKTISIRCAMRVENDFIVGYGLDYNGLGRNLPDLYRLKDV